MSLDVNERYKYDTNYIILLSTIKFLQIVQKDRYFLILVCFLFKVKLSRNHNITKNKFHHGYNRKILKEGCYRTIVILKISSFHLAIRTNKFQFPIVFLNFFSFLYLKFDLIVQVKGSFNCLHQKKQLDCNSNNNVPQQQ